MTIGGGASYLRTTLLPGLCFMSGKWEMLKMFLVCMDVFFIPKQTVCRNVCCMSHNELKSKTGTHKAYSWRYHFCCDQK